MKKLVLSLSILFLSSLGSAWACTDFRLNAQDKSIMIARSMEFADDMHANLRTSNRDRLYQETAPDGKPGMSWRAKYGYVFLDAYSVDVALDGLNEAGLSIEALYLPGETEYQKVPDGKDNQALSYLHFCDWVLANFKSIDEIQQVLGGVYVFSQTIPEMGTRIFPLHFAIHDASGKSMVVEFTKGQMQAYDNQLGVLTNSPTYEWQMINLRNYVNVTPITPAPVKFGNMSFIATGQGAGMKGLPGDVSPPSRFAKVAVYKAASYQPLNAAEALNLAQHIINNVDIPLGTVRTMDGDKTLNELTQWVVFKDLVAKIVYYRSYQDTTLHSVELSKLDFSPKAQRLKMPIADKQYILDMTKTLQAAKT